MKTEIRRKAWRFGLTAESRAAWYLVLKGYRILARRYKTQLGEIDVIARRGRTLCFIEIKARTAEIAETPVTNRQMLRIYRASQLFWQALPDRQALKLRYDVILMQPRRWPEHLIDVWRP